MASNDEIAMDQIVKDCINCTSYAKRPDKIGHINCPRHRPCSGDEEWEPENCVSCRLFRHNLGSLSHKMHSQALYSLTGMLKKMRDSFDKSWHYHDKKTNFLGDQLKPSSSSLRSPTIRTEHDLDQSVPEQVENLQQNEQTVHDNAPAIENNTVNPVSQPGPFFSPQQLAEALRPMFQSLALQIANSSNTRPITPETVRSITPDPERFSPIEHYQTPESSTSEERPPFFTEFGHFWFYVTHRTKIEGHKVWLNDELKPFIRHPSKPEAIRTIEESAEDSPYMTRYQAFQTLISFFGADRVSTDKLGPKNRSFRLHLDEKSGLAHAMQILHTCSPSALHNLHSGDRQNFLSAFTSSVFEAVSVVHFSSGWNFTNDSEYFKFAKDEVIDLKKTAEELKIYKYKIYVQPKLLQAERSARRSLIECISGLAMLDRNIAQTKDASQASSLSATARQFLSILKDITGRWIEAKYAVRQMAIQFSKSPASDSIMLSDVWHAELFAPSEVKAFLSLDLLQRGTMTRLNLSEGKNDKIKKNTNQCSCYFKRRERSRSPIRQFLQSQQPFRSQQPYRSQQGYNKEEAYKRKGSTQFQTQAKGKTHYSKSQQKSGKKHFPPKNSYTKTNPAGGYRGSKQEQS